MLPPTPRYSDKLIILLALVLPHPTLSQDKSLRIVPAILAAPGPASRICRHTQPQAKGECHRRLRGGTYATSATLRPLVDGVVLPLSDASANRGNGLRFAQNPPVIRSLA